jgi:peptide/nickel transport system permease protein
MSTSSALASELGVTALQDVPDRRKRTTWKRFKRNKLAMAGMIIVIAMYMIAIFAPFIQRYEYDVITAGMRNTPPSAEHWLGTDRNGRDVYSRMVNGARVSLFAGFAAVAIVMTVGVLLGGIAGFFGGFIDSLIMRFTDVLLSIPLILLLITAASLFKPGLSTTIIVIGLTSWPGAARLIRGQFLALKSQEYVTAARAIGANSWRMMFRHLLPNTMALVIVEATLWLGFAILLEASLSYLGLGVLIPTPSWGNMLQDGQRDLIMGAWWMTVFPGMAIFLTVLAFNLMGDGLRDALDPRHRKR